MEHDKTAGLILRARNGDADAFVELMERNKQSMYKTAKAVTHYEEYGRQRLAVGVNYYPLKEVVLKGEYSIGLLKSKFNNEPAVSVGVAYAGFFNL